MPCDRDLVVRLSDTADRLDELAGIADLMGDESGAERFRREASTCRARAMALLDADQPGRSGDQ